MLKTQRDETTKPRLTLNELQQTFVLDLKLLSKMYRPDMEGQEHFIDGVINLCRWYDNERYVAVKYAQERFINQTSAEAI